MLPFINSDKKGALF